MLDLPSPNYPAFVLTNSEALSHTPSKSLQLVNTIGLPIDVGSDIPTTSFEDVALFSKLIELLGSDISQGLGEQATVDGHLAVSLAFGRLWQRFRWDVVKLQGLKV